MDATPPRLRPRFSLLNLLLLTVTTACAAVIVRQQQDVEAMRREVLPLRQELKKYRNEAGGLEVDDPTKAYAIRMPGDAPDEWRYRVFLPKGRRYLVAYRVNDLPLRGAAPDEIPIPGGDMLGSIDGGGYCTIDPGEHILRLAVVNRGDGEWATEFTTQAAGAPSVKSSFGGSLGTQGAGRWPEVRGSVNATGGVFDQQAFVLQGRPIVLLDHRSYKANPGASSANAPDGVMVWLQASP